MRALMKAKLPIVLGALAALSGCYPYHHHYYHRDGDCLLDACLVGTCFLASPPPPPAVVYAPPPQPVAHRHGPNCGCPTRSYRGETIYWLNGHWEWEDGEPVR